MKIAHLIAHLSSASAGIGGATSGLAWGLARGGHAESHVLGIRDPNDPNGWKAWSGNGVAVHPCRQYGPSAFGWAPGLPQTLTAVDPDVVHVQGLWMYPSLASLQWYRRKRRPYLVAPQGMLDPWALNQARLKKALVSRWFQDEHLRRAGCLHALNAAEASAMRAYGLTNPICIVPNGVDLPPAVPEKPRTDTKTLLFLGRIDRKKGVRELIQAWSLTQETMRLHHWRLQVSGWGNPQEVAGARALVEEMQLDNTVELTGPLFGREKAAAFVGASAFILPSFSEGMPVAVLEAWSYRLPVIMTPQCNIPEGFESSAAIRTLPETKAVADALVKLAELPDPERIAMGGTGRALVETRFTWDRIAADLAAVYNWMLGGGSPPSNVLRD